jgi:hypothetical protein
VRRMIEEVWNDHDFTTHEEFVAVDHFEHPAFPEHQHGHAGGRHTMEWACLPRPPLRRRGRRCEWGYGGGRRHVQQHARGLALGHPVNG